MKTQEVKCEMEIKGGGRGVTRRVHEEEKKKIDACALRHLDINANAILWPI